MTAGPRQFEMVLDGYECRRERRPTTNAPFWAWRLMRDCLRRHGWADGQLASLQLDWSRTKGAASCGMAWPRERRVCIGAGSDGLDCRLVVLHETAHLLTPDHHHDLTFWRMAFRLYAEEKVPSDYAVDREGGYRWLALEAAREQGINVRGWDAQVAHRAVVSRLQEGAPAQLSLGVA